MLMPPQKNHTTGSYRYSTQHNGPILKNGTYNKAFEFDRGNVILLFHCYEIPSQYDNCQRLESWLSVGCSRFTLIFASKTRSILFSLNIEQ